MAAAAAREAGSDGLVRPAMPGADERSRGRKERLQDRPPTQRATRSRGGKNAGILRPIRAPALDARGAPEPLPRLTP